jgi:predicted HicB family RNase H-like nuclease
MTSPPDAAPMARVSTQVTLRVDPDLYVRARDTARTERRSLNEWIVQAIEAQLAREGRRGG